MELLAPAGNVQKLYYCYEYGADAAYIGLKQFSLRVKADNFYADEYKAVCALKERFPNKKLHCALNISFHNAQLARLREEIPYIKKYPIDAFIVQDLGVVPLLQKEFPYASLHLSTQASCINAEAVKMYKSLGFSRIVLGREASLSEIKEIKDAVPDMEIECFVHGAMCIAYSGRCLMSAYLNGRSAQEGFCSHTCRWDYDVIFEASKAKELAESGALFLREHKRPDELFPVYEGDNFTAVLSSKDLCMIDHLADLQAAGVDSLKIEGRMKSVYYVALTTRAYRKALDVLEGKITQKEALPFTEELYHISHRPYTTAFYYNKAEADITVSGESKSDWDLCAVVGDPLAESEEEAVFCASKRLFERRQAEYDSMVQEAKDAYKKSVHLHPDKCLPCVNKIEGFRMFRLDALNVMNEQSELELVTPNVVSIPLKKADYYFVNPNTGEIYRWVCHGHPCVLYTSIPLFGGELVRGKRNEKERED